MNCALITLELFYWLKRLHEKTSTNTILISTVALSKGPFMFLQVYLKTILRCSNMKVNVVCMTSESLRSYWLLQSSLLSLLAPKKSLREAIFNIRGGRPNLFLSFCLKFPLCLTIPPLQFRKEAGKNKRGEMPKVA